MDSFSADDLAAALNRCESEPIHQLGLIQPHGALIVCGTDAPYTVVQLSGNISRFFDGAPSDILGKPLEALIGADQVTLVDAALARCEDLSRAGLSIYSVVGDTALELDASVHRLSGGVILEVEPIRIHYSTREVLCMSDPLRASMVSLEVADDTTSYFQVVAELVRTITAFDRVMIYHFDAKWDGEVIAESRIPEAASYLGNRFPAGDIPPQARALYARSRLRMVSDIDAVPVPIEPATNPLTGQAIDLSLSLLRAFSPVHVEYLRNMGVRSSLSISILLDGKLWGLIACHHSAPAFLANPLRETLEFVGSLISMKLAALEASATIAQHEIQARTTISLLKNLYAVDDSVISIQAQGDEILALANATGAVLLIDGTRCCVGKVPTEAQIDRLIEWLAGLPPSLSVATHHLASLLPEAEAYADVAAGLLAAPVSPTMRHAILWFRPEKVRTVNWAGRPEKDVVQAASGELRISPRKSFSVWSETWRLQSEAWTTRQVDSGVMLSEALEVTMTQGVLKRIATMARVQNELLRLAPVGIARLAYRKFVEVNDAFNRILGYSDQELIGRTTRDIYFTDQQFKDVGAMVYASLSRSEMVNLEFSLRHKNGSAVWAIVGTCSLSASDPIADTFLMIQDISEHKALESQLAATAAQAKLAEHAKDAFLQRMTHELHTPLNGILGTGQLIEAGLDDPELKSLSVASNESARNLLRMVDMAIQFASLDDAKPLESFQTCTLGECVEVVLWQNRKAAESRSVVLHNAIESNDRAFEFESNQKLFSQLLSLVVENAIRFNRPQGAVTVSALIEGDSDRRLTVSVVDTGVGMGAEQVKTLSEPFVRYCDDGNQSGFGLGMALCERIASLLGGTIQVQSAMAQGTAVHVSLPVVHPIAVSPAPTFDAISR